VIAAESGSTEKQAQGPSQVAPQTNGFNSHDGEGSRGGRGGYDRGDRGGGDRGFDRSDRPKVGAMEVAVDHNIEKAMKVLKRKLIKEGLFKELKSRRYYEKPSEKRKRKHKESVKKMRKEESRNKKNSLIA
jgi:small subunit ribosomal protein S21